MYDLNSLKFIWSEIFFGTLATYTYAIWNNLFLIADKFCYKKIRILQCSSTFIIQNQSLIKK